MLSYVTISIDVLEETLDGKNTFHCTQMALWQRGPNVRSTHEHKIGQQAALKSEKLFKKLHKIDFAKLPVGSRPPPLFEDGEINIDEWFQQSELDRSSSTNLAWGVSRQREESFHQSVPSWSAFHESISQHNPSTTSLGMMPILQAPADNNDTMTA